MAATLVADARASSLHSGANGAASLRHLRHSPCRVRAENLCAVPLPDVMQPGEAAWAA